MLHKHADSFESSKIGESAHSILKKHFSPLGMASLVEHYQQRVLHLCNGT